MSGWDNNVLLDLAQMFDLSQPRNWLMVCGIALVVGYFCLKGFHRG